MPRAIIRVVMSTWIGMGCALAEDAPKTITVPVCESPPKLDADLSDACWSSAVKLTGFSAAKVFGPTLGVVQATPLALADGRDTYGVETVVRNRAGLGGRAELVVVDRPRDGEPTETVVLVDLGGREEKTVSVRVSMDTPGAREARILLRLPDDGAVLQTTAVADMDRLLPVDAYLDRNYYTTETEARVHVDILLDRSAREAAKLTVTAEIEGADDRMEPCRAAVAASEVALPLPLAEVKPGTYPVRVRLESGERRELGTVTLKLHRRPAAPEGVTEVKIDRYNRCLLLNGQPFFPLGGVGAWCHGPIEGATEEFYRADLGRCRDAGFNVKRHRLSVAAQKELSAEVQALAPALLTREPDQEVSWMPETACFTFGLAAVARHGKMEDPKYPLVRVSLRTDPRGGQVLLAVNPNREALHPAASLYMSGDPNAITPIRELDASFDAGVMIGMHAMIGAERGYMDHSFNSTYVAEMRVNDDPIGEVGIEALLCGYFGVPVILVSGDRTVCRETKALLGNVETVETKTAFSRYAAINRNPTVVRDELRETAERALRNRESFAVKRLPPPYTLQIETTTPNSADLYERRGAKRLGHRTILLESDDFVDLWAQRQGWAPGVHNARFGVHPEKVFDTLWQDPR